VLLQQMPLSNPIAVKVVVDRVTMFRMGEVSGALRSTGHFHRLPNHQPLGYRYTFNDDYLNIWQIYRHV